MITNATQTYISVVNTKLKIADDIRRHYGKVLAPRFNSFDFWYIDENKISEILAFFLSPTERHEQGDKFLRIFFEKIKIPYPYEGKQHIKVKTERHTDDRRKIDIVVSINKDEFALGIENKIYIGTQDQPNQIKDYLTYLSKISKDNYCLVYLSPKGKELSEYSLAKDEREFYVNSRKLLIINYEEVIIDCINSFSINCEADRVRSFLMDFEKKLKQMYMGEKFIDEQEILTEYALENIQNLEVALKISQSMISVKGILKKQVESQFIEIGKELDVLVNGSSFIPKNWKNNSISFSYESGGFLYGMKRKVPDDMKIRYTEIENVIGESWSVSRWWSMYQFLYRDIENNSDFWVEIRNGKLKEKVKIFVQKIITNFDTDKY